MKNATFMQLCRNIHLIIFAQKKKKKQTNKKITIEPTHHFKINS